MGLSAGTGPSDRLRCGTARGHRPSTPTGERLPRRGQAPRSVRAPRPVRAPRHHPANDRTLTGAVRVLSPGSDGANRIPPAAGHRRRRGGRVPTPATVPALVPALAPAAIGRGRVIRPVLRGQIARGPVARGSVVPEPVGLGPVGHGQAVIGRAVIGQAAAPPPGTVRPGGKVGRRTRPARPAQLVPGATPVLRRWVLFQSTPLSPARQRSLGVGPAAERGTAKSTA